MRRATARRTYECQACGFQAPRWEGCCRGCGEWNSLKEREKTERSRVSNAEPAALGAGPVALDAVGEEDVPRLAFDMTELDRVLGGGIVRGSVVLLGGDPGIGKSTLLLQACARLSRPGGPEAREEAGAGRSSRPVLYVSGEESAEQIKLRAARLGVPDARLLVLSTPELETVLHQVERLHPLLVVVDSIQTLGAPDVASAAGSVAQIQTCAQALTERAKTLGVPMILTGHVTKEGGIAGPRLLEHAVDVVLYMAGEATGGIRLIHGVKNRFGGTDEVGVFEMRGTGLHPVADPSEVFLSHRQETSPGSAVACIMEGTRPLLIEVQALTNPSSLPSPRRVASGIDASRLHLILAVLARRVGMPLGGEDVIVNVPGGMRVREPGADLALALAIASSFRDVPVAPGFACAAEVGLAGELRPVSQGTRRAEEAARLGFERCILAQAASALSRETSGQGSRGNARREPSGDREFEPGAYARTLADAIDLALSGRRAGRIAGVAATSSWPR